MADTEGIFTVEDIKQSDGYQALGPEYFASRRLAEAFISGFEAEQFKPMIDEFTKQFNDKLWTGVADSLVSDTESNLHLEISRIVEGTVRAILSGEKWALNRYVLAAKYDCEKTRAAVSKHIPEELQNARISDLEAEITKLRDDLRFYREYR